MARFHRLLAGIAAVALVATLPVARAQFSEPVAKPSPATLFANQCATCHSLAANDPPRQGPTLAGVIGRKVGSVPGFTYSPGLSQAGFTWDADHLDTYLTNPQAMLPGAVMPYRQANSEVRRAIISYLEAQQ